LLELVVPSDEVSLGIDLDQRRLLVIGGKANQAFRCDTPCFLGGFGKTLSAQPIDRGLHVTGGFVGCRLSVHHARAGLLAQVLHHRCTDRCHAILCRARLSPVLAFVVTIFCRARCAALRSSRRAFGLRGSLAVATSSLGTPLLPSRATLAV